MTPDLQKQALELFTAALQMGPDERRLFLDSACGSNPSLRVEVEQLLAAHEESGTVAYSALPRELAAAPAPSSAPPRMIGRYRVLNPLGRGGMGEVYLAEDLLLGRRVAIKVLPARFSDNSEHVRRFIQEAKAASSLNHPNIITVHEIGEAEPGRYIVMEYVVGRTLRAMMATGPTLDSIVHWARQIAEALSVAHGAGIVHRDIKPENIMVRDDGYVKVLDFGLARLSVDDPNYDAITHPDSGALMGTLKYMAPEQTRGETATTSTDVFAFGVLLYELATGQHPFNARTAIAALQSIAQTTPAPPLSLNPALPQPLDALLQHMLEKEPAARPGAIEIEAKLAWLKANHDQRASVAIAATAPLEVQATAVMSAPPHLVTIRSVGREREREEMREALAGAEAGRGLLLCVAGEPGIGKTTLVEDFLAESSVGVAPCRIARGRCSERLAGTEAYMPWLEALDHLLAREQAPSEARTLRVGDSVAHIMRQIAPTWYAQLAPLGNEGSSAERLLADVKSASQERMKRELSALLQELSRTQPLVFFFDDLHWADVSTIDLLNFLGGKLAGMRVLIVATYRPSDLMVQRHPFLKVKPELQARGVCREMMLDFLTRGDVERYLAMQFAEHGFPPDLVELIHAKTEGNPLFMADLVRYLRDKGVIAREDNGRWALAGSLPAIEQDLPESVRGMIERKIAQLEEADRQSLTAASVQGTEFDSSVLAEALSLDAADVEDRLENLQRMYAFVRLTSETEFPDKTPTLRYRFIHVLYQNELYASLRPTRRAQWSAAIARSLAEHWGEQRAPVASRLARLYETARDFPKAAAHYLIAAERAANKLANVEATQLARAGLEMAQAMPQSADRIQLELKLRLTLGYGYIFTEGYASASAGESMAAARALCERIGETPALFSAIWGLWLYYTVSGNLAEARVMGEQLLRLGEQVGDPMMLVGGHFALGLGLTWMGDTIEGHGHFEKGRGLYDPAQHRAYRLLYRTEPGIACHSFVLRGLWLLGYPEQGKRMLADTLALVHRLDDPHDLAFTQNLGAGFHVLMRDADTAIEMANACLALCDQYSLVQERQWATIWLGAALAEKGRLKEGLALIRASVQAQSAMQAQISFPQYLSLIADIHCKAGEPDEGLTVLDEAFRICARTGESFFQPELLRIQGELLLRKGATAEAEACFVQAIDCARARAAKSLELRATSSLCRLWRDQGRARDARPMLETICDWFTEGLDAADLKDARALLDSL